MNRVQTNSMKPIRMYMISFDFKHHNETQRQITVYSRGRVFHNKSGILLNIYWLSARGDMVDFIFSSKVCRSVAVESTFSPPLISHNTKTFLSSANGSCLKAVYFVFNYYYI